jgi:hypothetical protein
MAIQIRPQNMKRLNVDIINDSRPERAKLQKWKPVLKMSTKGPKSIEEREDG